MYPLTQTCVFSRQLNAVAAGQTDQDGAVLDMLGFDLIAGVAALGAFTDAGVAALELRGSPNANGSASVLEATTATMVGATSSNKLLILEAVRPANRFVFFRVKRSVQNIAIDAVNAIQARPRDTKVDIVASATVLNQTTAFIG